MQSRPPAVVRGVTGVSRFAGAIGALLALVSSTHAVHAGTPKPGSDLAAQTDKSPDVTDPDEDSALGAPSYAPPKSEESPKDKDADKADGAKKEAPPGSIKAAAAAPATEPVSPAASSDTEVFVQADDFSEQPHGFTRAKRETWLEWAGGLTTDVGYVSYTFDNKTILPEDYYDMRGRFVIGPTIKYRFGGNWFLRARGEGVLWVRETNTYQINADDVFGQVGQRERWDFKFGRFRLWRVYHKGRGFDLFTLEDIGACQPTGSGCSQSVTTNFAPHTYEVSMIYDRETAGHAAFHAYPAKFLAFELGGAYGATDAGQDMLGGRFAGVGHTSFGRVSVGAEYEYARPAQKKQSQDPMTGVNVDCPKCSVSSGYGVGGGVEFNLQPVELGANYAWNKGTAYTVANGTLDQTKSATTTSLGGYAEFDAGSLIFKRSLIFGFGLNRTEVLDRVGTFQQHYQGAAYVVYPLGFNNASVKLVLSRATYLVESDKDGDGVFQRDESAMSAARLRFTLPF
jgi:hypothetical protein